MLLENNIEALVQQLTELGLPKNIEYLARKSICFPPPAFTIAFRYAKGTDVMNTLFHFERKNNLYQCRYYDAALRKEIHVPEVVMNEVNLPDLDEKMRSVKWVTEAGGVIQLDDEVFSHTWHREETIEEVILLLQQLATSAEGNALANLLQFKYWSDTLLAGRIADINGMRNLYEVAQRFYFFDDAQQITVDEAYRFLCHRWQEKQLLAKKKQPATQKESGNESKEKKQTGNKEMSKSKRK